MGVGIFRLDWVVYWGWVRGFLGVFLGNGRLVCFDFVDFVFFMMIPPFGSAWQAPYWINVCWVLSVLRILILIEEWEWDGMVV